MSPMGANGQTKKRHECGEERHLLRDCPRRGTTSGSGGPRPGAYAVRHYPGGADRAPTTMGPPRGASRTHFVAISEGQLIEEMPDACPIHATMPSHDQGQHKRSSSVPVLIGFRHTCLGTIAREHHCLVFRGGDHLMTQRANIFAHAHVHSDGRNAAC